MSKVTATLVKGPELGQTLLRLALALGVSATMPALSVADEESPDIEFLEYLGSWEESDDEWLLFTDDAVADEDGADPESNADDVAATDMTELNNES